MIQEGFEALYEKYPRIVPEGTYFEHRSGWVAILDRYFAEVDAAVPADVHFVIRQIKEKFGTLRIYCGAVSSDPGKDDEVERALGLAKARAEARSAFTCEYCGKPGVLRVRNHYYFTACDEHAEGASIVEGEGETVFVLSGRRYRYDQVSDDLIEIIREVTLDS